MLYSHIKKICYTAAVILLLTFWSTHCSKEKSTIAGPENTALTDTMFVKKPNIYIYPTNEKQLTVSLSFPQGGYVTQSEPFYDNGWTITVDPSGLINETYRFLFYECKVPHSFQTNQGWIVAREDLGEFFRDNLLQYGFLDNEITDFLEYWIPNLQAYPWYNIYPQDQEKINQSIILHFSDEPESVQRVYYLFEGKSESTGKLATPNIPVFVRKGFTVVEWGGMVKK